MSGLDGSPTFILHDYAPAFVTNLDRFLNLVPKHSHFPGMWQLVYVCPVFKKEDKSKIQSCRPISILCSISQIFECVLLKNLLGSIKPITLYYHTCSNLLDTNYYFGLLLKILIAGKLLNRSKSLFQNCAMQYLDYFWLVLSFIDNY